MRPKGTPKVKTPAEEKAEEQERLRALNEVHAELNAQLGPTPQIDQLAEKLRKRIVKEEPVDENKYTPGLIPNDGLDDLDHSTSFVDPVDNEDEWKEMYEGVQEPYSPPRIKTEAERERDNEDFDKVYGDVEIVANPDKRSSEPEYVVIEDDDDEYEPPETLPVPTYSLPGLGVGGGMAFRPSLNPTRQTRGTPQEPSSTDPSAVPVAAKETAAQQILSPPANPYELPKETVQPSESLFFPGDHGFSTAIKRKLNLKGVRAPTVCFEGEMLGKPYEHMLSCGHAVTTTKIVACGFSCEQSETFDGKPTGINIQCRDPACLKAAKSRAAVFVPPHLAQKGRRAMTPHQSTPSHVFGKDAEADKKHQSKVFDRLGAFDMSGTDTTPGRRAKLGPQRHLRDRSASPPNVRTRAYRERDSMKRQKSAEEEAEQRLIQQLKPKPFPLAGLPRPPGREGDNLKMDVKEGMFALSNSRRAPKSRVQEDVAMPPPPASPMPKLPKEVANLAINARPALGFEMATQKARETRASMIPAGLPVANAEEMRKPDPRPNFFGNRGTRNDLSGYLAISEDQHDKLVQAEGGVIIPEMDTGNDKYLTFTGRGDRENLDDDMADQDLPDTGEMDVAETHCICRGEADGTMLPCDSCGSYYHPSCIGKGQHPRDYYKGDHRLMNLLDDIAYFAKDQDFTCRGCDTLARFRSQLKRQQAQGVGEGIMYGLRKRGTEKVKADDREIERTSQGRAFKWDAFGEVDSDDDDDNTQKAIRLLITSPEAEITTAYALPSVGVGANRQCDGSCQRQIGGVFYRCKQCIVKICEVCHHCVADGDKHDASHTFEVRHVSVSGPIKATMDPLEAGIVAEEAEALEAEDDGANDATMSGMLDGTKLEKKKQTVNEYAAARQQPSSLIRKPKPQTRKKSLAPAKRERRLTTRDPSGDVEMGDAGAPSAASGIRAPGPRRSTRTYQAMKSRVEDDVDAMEE